MIRKWISLALAVLLLLSAATLPAAASNGDAIAKPSAPPTAAEVGESTITAVAATAASAADDAAWPAITSVTPTTKGFVVKWSAYTDAAAYRLFVKNGARWKRVGDTTALTYTHTGLTDNTGYTYTVRALDEAGDFVSGYDPDGWTKVYHTAPVITGVAPSGNALKISWKELPGVDCYRVYRRNDGVWTSLGFSSSGSFTDSDVVSGEKYTYTVRAYSADHKEVLSAYDSSGVRALFVSVPKISRTESTANGAVKLTWTKAKGATQYRVFVKTASSWRTIGTTASLSFSYTAATGRSYTFTVRAVDAKGAFVSDYDRTGTTHRHLPAPTVVSVENVYGGQRVTWKQVSGAMKYRIYCKTASSSYKAIGDTASLSYTYTGAQSGTAYTYTVRCLSQDGSTLQSYFLSGVSARYYAAPEITSCQNLRSGALITWGAVDGVSRYRVFVKSSSWKKLGDIDTTSFLHTGVSDTASYVYTVRAIDQEGRFISGYNASGYQNTYFAAPAFTSVTTAADRTDLSWDAHTGAAAYRIYRRTFSGKWTAIAKVTGTAYTDTDVPADVPYQYTLRCVDAANSVVSAYLDDNPYYYNGAVANGKITVGSSTYAFQNGVPVGGYVTAQDIIRIAEEEVGTQANYYKKCKYNTWYYGTEVSGEMYDWCAVFVSWVFNEADALELIYGKVANCGVFGANFYSRGRLVTSGYRAGDIIFTHWDDSMSSFVPGVKSLDHAAIIKSVNSDGTYTTIEGNAGTGINGEVMILTRTESQISCAARPAYGFIGTASTAALPDLTDGLQSAAAGSERAAD